MRNKIAVVIVGLALVCWLTSSVYADPQPRMKNALANLEQAKANLENANADKGGHRVRAMKLVTAAIAEVRQGIAFDNTHSGKAENRRPKKR
ncbi:MAG: hypothetical protein FJ395_21860 [Verrucomicrobia bacterium]|nr:hypothetical protein [Verrucomicrobiota bacterium]